MRQDVIRRGQRLSMDHVAFFPLLCLVWLFLFWSLLPTEQTLESCQKRGRERERGREKEKRERERERGDEREEREMEKESEEGD